MKFVLVLTFIFFTIGLFSQEIAGIEYSPSGNFNWGMFQGKINPHHVATMGKNTGAVTVSSLNYKSDIRGWTATVKVSAMFIPSESWTRYPKLENPEEALNHEKRHFDICEIYARKMRMVIARSQFKRAYFNRDINTIFNKLANEEHAEQTQYDRETRHSIDVEQQEKWNARIDTELKEFAQYSMPVVKVALR
jgi:hypothetical protein